MKRGNKGRIVSNILSFIYAHNMISFRSVYLFVLPKNVLDTMYHVLEAWKNLCKKQDWIYLYVCMYICMCVYMYLCMYVSYYKYVRTHACILVILRTTKLNNKKISTHRPQTAFMCFENLRVSKPRLFISTALHNCLL